MIVDRPSLLPATKIRRDKRRIGRQMLDQLQHIPRRQIRIVRQDVTKVDAVKPAEVSNKLAAIPIDYFCEPEASPTFVSSIHFSKSVIARTRSSPT